MKIISLAFYSAITLGANHAYADMCDDFKNILSFSPTVTQVTAKADDVVTVPLIIEIDANEAKNWPEIYLSVFTNNGIAGSKSMVTYQSLLDDANRLVIPNSIALTSTVNMKGTYKLSMSIYGRDL